MAKRNVSATISPELKDLLERMAQQERRSMSNFLELLIEEKAVALGLLPPTPPTGGNDGKE
jgi:rubrerythrin